MYSIQVTIAFRRGYCCRGGGRPCCVSKPSLVGMPGCAGVAGTFAREMKLCFCLLVGAGFGQRHHARLEPLSIWEGDGGRGSAGKLLEICPHTSLAGGRRTKPQAVPWFEGAPH